MRKTIFANDEYYHVYNRGVDKREVFMNDTDYLRFLKSMKEFNTISPIGSLYELNFRKCKDLGAKPPIGGLAPKSKLVELIAYCLNPNHFHIILRQISDNGVSEFMKRIGGGYTSYFNKKYERSGSLFQGSFKSIHIDSNEYLLHVSAYVNKNNFIHNYDKNNNWEYSSYCDYIGERDEKLCNKEIISSQFKDKKDYIDFMNKTGEYFKDKKDMKKYLLE